MTIATPTAPAVTPAAPKVKTTADVLRHAALIIEERGLFKGLYVDDKTGAVCALGAINAADTGNPRAYSGLGNDAAGRLMDHLMRAEVPEETIIFWNDAPGRTAAEVVATLRAAADASERAS